MVDIYHLPTLLPIFKISRFLHVYPISALYSFQNDDMYHVSTYKFTVKTGPLDCQSPLTTPSGVTVFVTVSLNYNIS